MLTTGQPEGRTEWALEEIEDCGPLLAEVLTRRLSAERGVQRNLPALERTAELSRHVVDRSVFEQAFQVAGDASAGTAARVQAVRALLNQIDPTVDEGYANLVSEHPYVLVGTPHYWKVITPLPADALERVRTLLESIAGDASTSEEVRNAAMNGAAAAGVRARRLQHCTPRMSYSDCLRQRSGL